MGWLFHGLRLVSLLTAVFISGDVDNNKKANTSFLKTIGSSVVSSILDKPKYQLISNHNGIEERLYEPAKWVSTSIQGIEMETARRAGFKKLFKYITGTNERNMKVDMTAPVATRIVPGAGPNREKTFTVSFYIPPVHQKDPPIPTDKSVFIEDWPEMKVLSKSFGGFAKEESWKKEAKLLSDFVSSSEDHQVERGYWFTAGYNSPFQLFGRTNEVWFVKK